MAGGVYDNGKLTYLLLQPLCGLLGIGDEE